MSLFVESFDFSPYEKKSLGKKKERKYKLLFTFLAHTYLKDEILLANYKQLESRKDIRAKQLSSNSNVFLLNPVSRSINIVFPFLLIFYDHYDLIEGYKELHDGIRFDQLKHHDIVLIRNRIECLIEANLEIIGDPYREFEKTILPIYGPELSPNEYFVQYVERIQSEYKSLIQDQFNNDKITPEIFIDLLHKQPTSKSIDIPSYTSLNGFFRMLNPQNFVSLEHAGLDINTIDYNTLYHDLVSSIRQDEFFSFNINHINSLSTWENTLRSLAIYLLQLEVLRDIETQFEFKNVYESKVICKKAEEVVDKLAIQELSVRKNVSRRYLAYVLASKTRMYKEKNLKEPKTSAKDTPRIFDVDSIDNALKKHF